MLPYGKKSKIRDELSVALWERHAVKGSNACNSVMSRLTNINFPVIVVYVACSMMSL